MKGKENNEGEKLRINSTKDVARDQNRVNGRYLSEVYSK